MTLPTRFEDFEEPGQVPWLDRPDAEEAIAARLERGELTAEQAEMLTAWRDQGWLVLDCVVDEAAVDAVDQSVQDLIDSHDVKEFESWKFKLQNMHATSPAVRHAINDPGVLAWIDRIFGVRALPFQTLNMPIGSQIPPHSDHILMTTHPQGYMVAAWIALEDVGEDAGPLTLWTGSHRLPYLSAEQVGIPRDATDPECSRIYAERYYDKNKQLISKHGFEPYRFMAKKGQVLLWHSNILHGGAKITRPDATRKSLVVHYFGEGVHHYSDLFHRPSKVPKLRPATS